MLLRQSLIENRRNHGLLHFARRIVKRLTSAIQHYYVGNVAPIVLLNEILLVRRKFLIDIYHYEVDAAFIFLVEVNGAASLPLGIESTLAINNDVIRFALLGTIIHMVADDEWAILAVAAEVKFRIKAQIVGGTDRRRNYQKQYYRGENLLHSVLYGNPIDCRFSNRVLKIRVADM